MPRFFTLFLLTLTALLLGAACTAVPGQGEPTAMATVAATAAVTSPSPSATPAATATTVAATATATLPAATATFTPEPTAEPAVSQLPAPVYYLDEGQIYRLEADGQTVTPITAEAQPVSDYDVHPGSNLLVYVSGNDLVQSDLEGGNRLLLIDGPEFAEEDYAARYTVGISAPRISPDGSQIAFGQGGVNVIAPGDTSGNATLLQASDAYPDLAGGTPQRGPVRFFWPHSWAPDGSKIVVEFGYYPEGGGMAVYQIGSGALVDVTNPDGPSVGEWAWGANSQTGYIASNIMIYGRPGLVRVDANTGNGTTLIDGLPPGEVSISEETPARGFLAPFEMANGDLLTFAEVAADVNLMGDRAGYQIYQVSAGGSQMNALRPEAFTVGDVRWAEDGSGAVFVDLTGDTNYSFTGPLRWVPLDGGPVLDLPVQGGRPRWGG